MSRARSRDALRGLVAVVVALAASSSLCAAAAADTPPTPAEKAAAAELARVVEAGAPGAVLLVSGEGLYRTAVGTANLARKTPLTSSHRFRVGSVTKSFVAVVVLQLVGEGKLALGDSVERWLPGLVPNGKAITVRHLLGMSSGLFDYLNDGDKTLERQWLAGDLTHRWSPRQLVAIATRHRPHFAPGKGWSYCNTCYVLLGLIVEKATGHSLGDELRRRIFAPLALRATTFDSEAVIGGRHSRGYELLGKPPLVDVSVFSPTVAWAAGAIFSTAGDVARFYRALLGGRLLAPELLRAIETTRPIGSGAAYGLGLLSLTLPRGVVWGHDGGIPGYRTWALARKDGGRAVVVLANLGEDSLRAKGNEAMQRALVTAVCG